MELGAWSAQEVDAQVDSLMSAVGELEVVPVARPLTRRRRRGVSGMCANPHWARPSTFPKRAAWLGGLGRLCGCAGSSWVLFLRQTFALMKEYGYRGSPMYGHFGQGCVHLRINFDLESESGIRNFREFSIAPPTS